VSATVKTRIIEDRKATPVDVMTFEGTVPTQSWPELGLVAGREGSGRKGAEVALIGVYWRANWWRVY
jgi:hypothetical protein